MATPRRPRGITAALGLVAVTLTMGGCGGPSGDGSSTKTVRIGYNADFNSSGLIAIAEHKKLWAKHGLTAKTSRFTNGPLQIQAMGAGDLDVGSVGPGALWLPATGRGKIIAINSLGLADRLIAQPGITSVEELKGKKVGVPEGTSGDMILQLALQRAGMKAEDVQKVAMDPNTVVSAFSSGKIDAAGIWYPLVGIIKKSKPKAVELAKNEDFFPRYSFPCAFVASNKLVSEDPKTAKAVQKVLQEANDYRIEHLDDAIAITSGYIDVPEEQLKGEAENIKLMSTDELVKSTRDGEVEEWLQGLLELFVSVGKMDKPTGAEDAYAGDLYVEAAG